MVNMRITERGSLEVERVFEETATRAEAGLRPSAEAIHEIFLLAEHYQYEYGGRRGRFPWAPLSPEWIRRKRQAGYRTKKGIMTGNIMNSLTDPSDPNHIFAVEGSNIGMGSTDPKMPFLQDEGAKRNHPYRPPIDLTVTDIRKMTKAVSDTIISRRMI